MTGFFKKFSRTDAYERLQKRYERRIKEERIRQIEEGNRKRKPFLYRIDRLLEYSGLRGHVLFVNAEMFIVASIVALSGVFSIVSLISGSITAGIVTDAVICVAVYGIMYTFNGNYYAKLEENIMTLLNLIENFNKTEDDIVEIFRKTIPYTGEPIRHILTEFCSEAKAYGDVNQAFDNMGARIEHRKCRELIHNMQVCSRYESNYEMLIRDCRKSMMDYLEIKAERKAIMRNGKAEIIILLASAVFIVFLFTKIVSESLVNLLLSTLAGNAILIYCIMVVLLSVIMIFAYDKKGGD